jgi:hypothetical protein
MLLFIESVVGQRVSHIGLDCNYWYSTRVSLLQTTPLTVIRPMMHIIRRGLHQKTPPPDTSAFKIQRLVPLSLSGMGPTTEPRFTWAIYFRGYTGVPDVIFGLGD